MDVYANKKGNQRSNMSNEIALKFTESRLKLIKFLSDTKNRLMVLSTCEKNKVTSRTVWIENDQLSIYFFTWSGSRKCRQIEENPSISLCRDVVEIEGNAKFVGPMFDSNLKNILNLFTKRDAASIKQWETKKNMVIYKIEPYFARIDGYKNQNEVIYEYIDFKRKLSYKEKWSE